MQFTLFTPILLLLTAVSALPTPDSAASAGNSTSASADGTDHYPHSTPNPIVATVDRWGQGGCRPQVCNHNFLVNLNGCSVVPKGCSTSAKITTASDNCYCMFSSPLPYHRLKYYEAGGRVKKRNANWETVKIWTDNKCSSQKNVITVRKEWGGIGQCEQPGPQIGSISAVCH
jgi:hypothetical protein